MITEMVADFAVKCLDATGYWGAAFLMALESMIAPVPSEAVMPFVGFQVADGKWNLIAAILATSAGSIIGSLLSYALGYYGGRPLVLKVGRYLLLSIDDLNSAERFFNRRAGAWTLFISRFVPVVRHLISIPAGMGKMRLWPFLVATFVGATLWNSFLLWLGMKLRENWKELMELPHMHLIDKIVVVAIILAAIAYVYMKLRRSKKASLPKVES